MQPWRTIKRQYLQYAPRYGNVVKEHVKMSNGFEIEEYIINEYPDWVNAVVITEKGKVLLVEQYRHAAGDFFFEIPAGMAEEGETNEEAIIREVKEETGYTSKEAPVHLGSFFPNPATSSNQVHSYLLVDAKQGEQNLDEGEELFVHSFSWEELDELELTQMFSVTSLMLAKKQLGF